MNKSRNGTGKASHGSERLLFHSFGQGGKRDGVWLDGETKLSVASMGVDETSKR